MGLDGFHAEGIGERLGEIIGFTGVANWLAQPLERVMRYCATHELPPLTVLVVNRFGKPSDGLTTSTDFDQDRERIYDYQWFQREPLTVEDLAI